MKILLLLIRFEKLDTDLLVNISIPWKKQEYSEQEWGELIKEGNSLMGVVKGSLDASNLGSIL